MQSQYSGKRIALILDVQGREVVLRGTTALRTNAQQSQVLQVTIAEGDEASLGRPVFLISESRWRERLTNGWLFDCDYCLDLTSARTPVRC